VKVEFDNGLILKCADTHKLISEHEEEIFAKDSIGRKIISKNSNLNVTKVTQLEEIGLWVSAHLRIKPLSNSTFTSFASFRIKDFIG
jgi:hypothetical protein